MSSEPIREAADLEDLADFNGAPGQPGQNVSVLVLPPGGHTNFHYDVGRIILADEFSSANIILVAEQDQSTICAVPYDVWNRKVSQRLLPRTALSRPVLCSVAACHQDTREEPEAELQMKVWVGILSTPLLDGIHFGEDLEVDHGFRAPGLEPDFLPYAQGLVDILSEKFDFYTAESGGGGAPPGADVQDRLSKLESGIGEIRSLLERLAPAAPSKDAVARSLRKDVTPTPDKRAGALRKGGEKKVSFAGLDGAVVDAALQAGIPESHLQEMSSLLSRRPSKMEDLPRPNAAKGNDPLSDSEEEDEELIPVDEHGSPGGSSSDGGVAKAIVKLTRVCARLAKHKTKKKGDQLEQLLDLGLGSEFSSEGSGSGSTKKAAALRALRRHLNENPRLIYENIESNMASDFASRPVRPGEPRGGATARGWLEARSRVQNFTGHVRWCWQVAGIWDALMADQPEQARARRALLMSAADQSSIDSGSWTLAQQVLLEAPPPYHSFSSHSSPSMHERQHTALLDPRWLDILLHYVKELDSYQEARRRLGGKGNRRDEDKDKEGEKALKLAKAKAKSGTKGKGKSPPGGGIEDEESSA